MLRSSFFWRLYLSYAALILVTLALSWVLCARWIERAAMHRLEGELLEKAVMLRDMGRELLARGYDPEAQARIRELGREIGTRITLVRLDGTVVADSDEDPRVLGDHSARPEIRAALEGRAPAQSLRTSATLGFRMMYLADPLTDEAGELRGVLRTARRAEDVSLELAPLRRLVVLAGALAALIAFGVGLVFGRGVTSSLRSMTAVAETMAAGGYHERVHSTAAGELGRLARAFDTMAEELERRVEAVTTDRNQIAAILAGMVEGVVAIDQDERVLHMNQVAARLLRAVRTRSQGLYIWEATRQKEVREILAEAMRVNGPVRRELRVGGPEGPALELHAGPLTGGRGELVGAVLVLNDVTELRRLEAVRRDFVANVSHELKTPLTAIRGMIETILDDPAMPPAVRQRFFERIEEQSQRLSTLVTDLLTLSRLESESPRREREVVDLREVVSSSVARLRPAAEGKRIRLVAELAADAMWVLGDEEELRQMVDNLVDNAVKYTPEEGRVRVALAPEAADPEAGPACCLVVSDNGIGIDPEHQERIFERFYRVDKARSRELGGTGLGLSIVKHVTKDVGGTIALESAPGLGTTFRVRLPLAG